MAGFYELQGSDVAAVSPGRSSFLWAGVLWSGGVIQALGLGLDAAIAAREKSQGTINHQQGSAEDRWGSRVFLRGENKVRGGSI